MWHTSDHVIFFDMLVVLDSMTTFPAPPYQQFENHVSEEQHICYQQGPVTHHHLTVETEQVRMNVISSLHQPVRYLKLRPGELH